MVRPMGSRGSVRCLIGGGHIFCIPFQQWVSTRFAESCVVFLIFDIFLARREERRIMSLIQKGNKSCMKPLLSAGRCHRPESLEVGEQEFIHTVPRLTPYERLGLWFIIDF